jgi:hypothetical protein
MPQLALFISTNTKDLVLKHIFPQNNIGRQGERGNINLHLETGLINHNVLLLFVDSSLFIKNLTEHSHVLYYKIISYTACWRSDYYTIIDVLYIRLLFLFSNVICVFADDFSSIAAFLLCLMTWVEIRSTMAFLPELHPQLLIIVSEEGIFLGSPYKELCNRL